MKNKLWLGLVAAVLLAILAIPALGLAEGSPTQVSTEQALNDAISTAPASVETTIQLTGDIDLNSKIEIPEGKKIVLDLNGYVLKGTKSKPVNVGDDARIILNKGKLTIKDSRPNEGEHYFIVQGDDDPWALLESPTPEQKNGAIDLNSISEFAVKDKVVKVTGGIITGGKGYRLEYSLTAGAIYNDVGAELIINSGSIIGNIGDYGGAIENVFDEIDSQRILGKVTINGGTIAGNYGGIGGAITNYADLTITGGIITNNKASSAGAIDAQNNRTTITGGKIEYNSAYSKGGAIHMTNFSEVIIKGGIISNNEADNIDHNSYGGAIYLQTGSLIIENGTITNNKASGNGGGVYIEKTPRIDMHSMTIGGATVIKDNKCSEGDTDNNLYLNSESINISQNTPLASGASVGITNTDYSVFATGAKEADKSYFEIDDSDYKVYYGNATLRKVGNVYKVDREKTSDAGSDSSFEAVLPTLQAGDLIQLTADIGLSDKLELDNNKNIILDLNGHILDDSKMSTSSDAPPIYNQGKLRIIDSNPTSTHTGSDIKGGIIACGKGERSNNNFECEYGGEILNVGTLIIEGGTYTGGKAQSGGGIYNTATLSMIGGTITGNKASSQGGGIWNSGTLTLTGGTISDNTAATGGGVYMYSANNLTIGGTPVIKNNKLSNGTTKSNLDLRSYFTISEYQALADGADIGITYSGTGTIAKNAKEGSEAYFTADESTRHIWIDNNYNELKIKGGYPIYRKLVPAIGKLQMYNRTTSENNVFGADAGNTIVVQKNQSSGYDFDTILVYKTSDASKTNIIKSNDNSFTMPAESVTVEVSLKKHSYSFTTNTEKKGTITLTNSEGTDITKTGATSGTTVTVNVKPNFKFYNVDKITVCKYDDSSKTVAVSEDNTFVMPEYNVLITATLSETDQPCPVHRAFRKIGIWFKDLFS